MTARLASGEQTPAALTQSLLTASHYAPVAPVTRLYWAYFLRRPDHSGLSYWADRRRSGTPLATVSQSFASSPEFRERYGSLTNRQFVERIYQNILGRPGESAGVNYWTDELDAGNRNRGTVMIGFSESPEYRARMAKQVDVVLVYAGMLGRVPTTAELAADAPKPLATVIDTIRLSSAYAARVA